MSMMHSTSTSAAVKVAILRRIGLLMAFLMVLSFTAFAQTDENWEDDDDEDETEEKALVDDRPAKKEDVTIHLNEELYTWRDELTVHRNDTLTISVRDLAGGTRVEINADKGGITLAHKVFYANAKGELDLEIRVGNKKMKGNIELGYTPSGAPKKTKTVHLTVD